MVAKFIVFTPLCLWFITAIAMFYFGQTVTFYIILFFFTVSILVVSILNFKKIQEYASKVKAKESELENKNRALKEQLYIDNLTKLLSLIHI